MMLHDYRNFSPKRQYIRGKYTAEQMEVLVEGLVPEPGGRPAEVGMGNKEKSTSALRYLSILVTRLCTYTNFPLCQKEQWLSQGLEEYILW